MIGSPHNFRCATYGAAERIRSKYPDCLAECDDRRTMTVSVVADTPSFCLDEMARISRESHAEIESQYGQVELTADEKKRIDFSRVSVFHARSCKAIARAHGVSDWTALYDYSLTVDEHRDLFARESASGQSMRQIPTEQWAPRT